MIPDEKYDFVRQLIQRQFDSDSEVYLTLSVDGVVTFNSYHRKTS